MTESDVFHVVVWLTFGLTVLSFSLILWRLVHPVKRKRWPNGSALQPQSMPVWAKWDADIGRALRAK